MSCSTTDEDGRDGIPGDDGDAGKHGAEGTGGVAVDDDFAFGGVHRLENEGILLGEGLRGVVEAGFDGGPVQVGGFLLFRELLAQGAFHGLHVHGEQLGGDADVDHVLDQLAQLGFRTDGGGDLVEGHRIAGDVVAILLQVGRLLIDGHGAGAQREDIFARGFGIHGDEDVDFFVAGDVAIFAGADGVPGGQAGDVGGEEVFATDRHAHGEDAAQQDAVRGLGAGTVDGGYLDAEIVNNGLGRSSFFCTRFALRGRGAGVGGRHVAVFPSVETGKILLFRQLPL